MVLHDLLLVVNIINKVYNKIMSSLSYSIWIDNEREKGLELSISPRRTFSWIPDENVDSCNNCNSNFTWYTRKHHCRWCGHIFCSYCSTETIETQNDDGTELIDQDKYLKDYVSGIVLDKTHRICDICMKQVKNLRKLGKTIIKLRCLPISIIEYQTSLIYVSKRWYKACSYILSNFREIQYKLPTISFDSYEKLALQSSFHNLIGHNKLMTAYIKTNNWDNIPNKTIIQILKKVVNIPENKITYCWSLMCCRECHEYFTDSDILDILMHVHNKCVRQYMIRYLSTDINVLSMYLPTLVYACRFENDITTNYKFGYTHSTNYPLMDFLVERCIQHLELRYKLYWELECQIKQDDYLAFYTNFLDIYVHKLNNQLGFREHKRLTSGKYLISCLSKIDNNNLASISHCVNTVEQISLINEIVLPLSPDIIIKQMHSSEFYVMQSATNPVIISCDTNLNKKYKFMYKKDDIRKDNIIISIINLMNKILIDNGLDTELLTYKVLPTSDTDGLIEIVSDSKTIYYIKEKTNLSIQNFIMNNNYEKSVKEIRERFIKNTAAYSVITYLLGVGDRHLDNIMVTANGHLFHIDYGFILGMDPKILGTKMRITNEMVDALGGPDSDSYKRFQEYCTKCFDILRRHATVFTNMLIPLTDIYKNELTKEQLELQIINRFIPGEFKSTAKILLINMINKTEKNSTWNDIIHYHYKETLTTNSVSSVMSSMTSWIYQR